MVIRIVKLPVTEGKVEEFLNHFNNSKQQIRTFEGCSQLELLCDTSNRNNIYTFSLWKSEQHLEKYLRSELFRSTWKTVKPLFYAKAEAISLEKLQSVDILNK